MRKIRVLMADDHSLMLAGLHKLLEHEPVQDYRCVVVGTVEDGRALVEAARRLRPDVILLDIAMPLLNGLDAAYQIKRHVPDAKLIFLTMHASPSYAAEAFKAGGNGYLLKRSAASELTQAIEAVLKGQHYLTPLITKDVLETMLAPGGRTAAGRGVVSLTPRQREVLQLVAEGRGTKEIAKLLNVSVKTVEFHKARIMGQVDRHSTAELVRYAIAEGLVTL